MFVVKFCPRQCRELLCSHHDRKLRLADVADEDTFVDEHAPAQLAPLGAEGEVFTGAILGGGPVAVHGAKLRVLHEFGMRAHFLENAAMHAHEAASGFLHLPKHAGLLSGLFLADDGHHGRIETDGALAVKAEDKRLVMLAEMGEVLGLEDEIGVDDDHLVTVAFEELLRGDVHGITWIRRAEMAEDAFAPQGSEHADGPAGDGEAHAVVDDGIEDGFVGVHGLDVEMVFPLMVIVSSAAI